jgi:phage terminase large subunit-like protein
MTAGVDSNKLRELNAALEELAQRRRVNALAFYEPSEKQRQFHAMPFRERLLAAGTQLGKTFAGSREMSMHVTGRYSADWPGRKFSGPIRAWAVGLTAQATRDTVQRLLLGPVGQHGTGAIPLECIREVRAGRGVADAVDTVIVEHTGGYPSQLTFKSAEQGREKFQGESLDLVWVDEEPEMDVYAECLARLTARDGILFMTFTPLKGLSSVARRFFTETSPDRGMVRMELEDAPHIAPEKRQQIIDGYNEWERDARVRGLPMLGEGRVYQIAESIVCVPPFEVPGHWAKLWGVDFGVREFRGVLIAHDRDADVVYAIDMVKATDEIPVMHAASLKARGAWIPVSWPADGHLRDKGSGIQLREIYKTQGLAMLPDHSQFENGSTSVEAGITECTERFRTGRLKMFSHLSPLIDEFRVYCRKAGRVVKENDHALDALRYSIMDLRCARAGPSRTHRRGPRIAADVAYNVFDYGNEQPRHRGGYRPDHYSNPFNLGKGS